MKKFLVATFFCLIIGVASAEDFLVKLSVSVTSVNPQQNFQVKLSTNLPIQKIDKNFLDIENAALLNITKVTSNTFILTLKTTAAQGQVKIRVKPGYIISTTGLKNTFESNEILVALGSNPLFTTILKSLNNLGQPSQQVPTPAKPASPSSLGSFGQIGGLLSSLLSKSGFGGSNSSKAANTNPPYQASTYQAPTQAPATEASTTKSEEATKQVEKIVETTNNEKEIIFARNCKDINTVSTSQQSSGVKYGKVKNIIFISQLSQASQAGSFNTEDFSGGRCSLKNNLVSIKIIPSVQKDSFIVLVDRSQHTNLVTSLTNSCVIFPEKSLIQIQSVNGYMNTQCKKEKIIGFDTWKKVSVSEFSDGIPVYIINPDFKLRVK